MSRWYRAYEGTVTDAKIGEAALVASCTRSVAIAAWHCILESCASAQDGGRFDTTPRRVAVILGEKPADIEAVFAAFAELEMVCGGSVTAWKQRQFESDTSTERSRKHRERQRNRDATLQQRDATPPETETDTDTEEREKSARSAEDPVHKKMAEAILSDHGEALDEWESDFLHSIKAKHSVTKAQAESLKAIQGKLRGKTAKPYALPSVKRGTAAYEAWIAYYRTRPKGAAFYEKLDALTVPSEFPPSQVAA